MWVAEAYGYDAPSLMGYLAAKTERVEIGAAILPIYTRTPTLIAMTAAGVDALSGGRCVLGLGASGPQVIEGFHGVPYDRPLTRTREIIDVCRQVWAREAPLVHDGVAYQIPLPEGQGTGLGKALKIIGHPQRSRIPIWVAALGEKNVAMTAEIADGWLPLFFVPEKSKEVFGASLDAGSARRARAWLRCRSPPGVYWPSARSPRWRPSANSVGPPPRCTSAAWGPRGRTSTTPWPVATGTRRKRPRSRTSILAGHKAEAAAKVPDELLEATSLCGLEGYLGERVAAMREAGVTHLNVTPVGGDPVAMIETVPRRLLLSYGPAGPDQRRNHPFGQVGDLVLAGVEDET